MIARLLSWVRETASDGDEKADTDDEESRFAGSLLDLSVIVGHGGSNAAAERELESVAEQAEELSEARDR